MLQAIRQIVKEELQAVLAEPDPPEEDEIWTDEDEKAYEASLPPALLSDQEIKLWEHTINSIREASPNPKMVSIVDEVRGCVTLHDSQQGQLATIDLTGEFSTAITQVRSAFAGISA